VNVIKGAPDVLIARAVPIGRGRQGFAQYDANRPLAFAKKSEWQAGERVMVVARKDFDPQTFDRQGNLMDLIDDLTLLAMVGIVDPPRREAKDAIAKCHSAGIQVRMITGDHVTTAAAIGDELGIGGKALTGTQFSAMTDAELDKELDKIAVIARVAPEDKLRLVSLLQKKNNIVAMTGDGVNEAPALKNADIGIAMGITGTDVSKDAAVMILTDDNFATIVNAVEYGRAIYSNLVKYIRFQMSTLVAFIVTFLGAAFFSIMGGTPFGAISVLWINFLIQAPLAIALGFDEPSSSLMKLKPRPPSQARAITQPLVRIVFLGVSSPLNIFLSRITKILGQVRPERWEFGVFALSLCT
jgi:Ca2+-transporting ATPase